MASGRRVTDWMRTSSARTLLLSCLALGCRNEGPSATISAEDAAIAEDAAESQGASGGQVRATSKSGAEGPPAALDRELWFAQGLGREAILARERQDHDAARRLLDELLTQKLSADARGGAQWLRGLEDLNQELYASAADRFAEAAKAPALAPLGARLARLEAQARLDAGEPDVALARVREIDVAAQKASGLREAFAVLEADALLRTDDRAAARKAYEGYLEEHPRGSKRVGVSLKLARMLSAQDDDADKKRAVALFETLLLETPLSEVGQEASRELPALRKSVGVRPGGDFERKVELARLDAMLDRRRYSQAIKAADKVLRGKVDSATRCRALYVKGSAIFKLRKRAKARPVFAKAATSCKTSSALTTYEVKSRYQGARGLYAAGKYADAAKAFTSLAEDHAKHSYADDAWVLAGESWAEARDEGRAKSAFESALKVEGDQLDEARRRLLLLAFAAGDDAAALRLCDAGLKRSIAHPAAEAKLHYFRGRALARTGDAKAAEDAYVQAVHADPLGFSSALAMSRLHELSSDAFARGVAMLQAETPKAHDAHVDDAAARAVLLAKLGLGDDAREELRVAEVKGWPAIAVLNQAGLYAEGQRTLANLGASWRRTPPGAANLSAWKLAHPLPFADLIEGYEQSHGVPDLLAYAVMQTESRFNPGATSWAGARGLIQLMPATAKGVAAKAGVTLGKDSLYDPATNLDLGMRYLSGLVERYGGGPGAVALAVPSYNAGAGAVDKWLGQRGTWDLDLFVEAIPYDETRKYTQSVVGRWWAYRWIYGEGTAEQRVPLLPIATPRRAD